MTTPLDKIKSAVLGVPFDPNKQPSRTGIVQAFAEMQTQLEGAQAGAIVKATRSALLALVSAPSAGCMAWVTNDSTAAYNGIYENTGTTGTPAWTKRTEIPQFFIAGINVGAGTVNAIQVTSDLPVPAADARALIGIPVLGANTVSPATVSINGGAALPIVTNSGNNVVIGGLVTGMIALGVVTGSTFRLLTDQTSAAIQAAAEVAAEAAETAQAAAEAAAASVASIVVNRTILKNVAVATGSVYLNELGREGRFSWKSGNYAALCTLDFQEGIYIVSNLVASTLGAWVRIYEGKANVKWFGCACDGTNDDAPTLEAALAMGIALYQPGLSYLSRQVVVSNAPMSIEGPDDGSGGFKMNGASTGGIKWTDTGTGLADLKKVSVRRLRFTTNKTGFTALECHWTPRPYFFDGSAGVFEDLQFITDDIASAYAWADMIYCEYGQGLSFARISGSNQRDVESGKGIRLKTCLVANMSNLNINYVDDSVYVEPSAFSLVTFGSQTVNFTDGDIITSSGGGVGRLMRTVSDAGATGTLAIIPISGAFSNGHTITGVLGGDGTITAVDNTRWYAGEGLYISGTEFVGVKQGLNVYNPNSVYQKFVGIQINNFHANAKVAPVNLEYCTQVEMSSGLLYLLANNAIGARLVGADKVRISTRIQDPSNYTGTVGIVISVGTAGFGTDTSDEVFYSIDFDGLDTDESLDPAATNITRRLIVDAQTGHLADLLRVQKLSADPAAVAGAVYYNTTGGVLKGSNGAAWFTLW